MYTRVTSVLQMPDAPNQTTRGRDKRADNGGGRPDGPPAEVFARAAADAAARGLSCYLMRNGMTSRATMLMTLIIGLMAGPAVSL